MIAALVPLCLAAGPAVAHDLTFTDTVVVFKTGGTYQVDMTCDLDALALGASPEVSSELLANELRALSDEELEAEIEDLRQYFLRRVRVIFDGEAAAPAVSFPRPRHADRRRSRGTHGLGAHRALRGGDSRGCQ